MGLWILARACWNHESTFEVGDRLASKALEAARRQTDTIRAASMLRERGLKALEKGDKVGAETRWSSLLGSILEDRLSQPSPTPATNRPTDSGRPERPVARVRVPAATLERFRQAGEFSRLAATLGMAELSLKAIRDSLKGGPPVVPISINPNATASTAVRLAGASDPAPDPTMTLVESMLTELDASWTANKIGANSVYETLRDVVLPPDRPTEIFLYDPNLGRTGRATPEGGKLGAVVRVLLRRAVETGKLDDLRQGVSERPASPTSRRLPGAIEEASRTPK